MIRVTQRLQGFLTWQSRQSAASVDSSSHAVLCRLDGTSCSGPVARCKPRSDLLPGHSAGGTDARLEEAVLSSPCPSVSEPTCSFRRACICSLLHGHGRRPISPSSPGCSTWHRSLRPRTSGSESCSQNSSIGSQTRYKPPSERLSLAQGRIRTSPEEAARLLESASTKMAAAADVHRRLHDPALFERGVKDILRDAVSI